MPTVGTVLVVDDEAEIVGLLRTALVGRGHRVLTASDRGSALRAAGLEQVDLVIADLNLAGDSGLEVIEELCASRSDLRSILITGDVLPAGERAAIHVIEKPFTLRSVAAAVDEVLGGDDRSSS